MLAESLTIFLIIFLVAVLYLRTKKSYALATVPLLILSFANITACLTSGELTKFLPMDKFTVYCAINLFAVILSSFFVGLWSNKFSKKSTRALYVTMSLIFNIVLAAILINNMYIAIYG